MGRPREKFSKDELRLLALLRDAAPGSKSATVASTATIARMFGCSAGKIKILRKGMIEKGLIEVTEHWAESGAQIENSYRLTRKGRRALAAQEDDSEGNC